jgi:hypothetical protein
MTEKKISELIQGSEVRGNDMVPYATGLELGETPATLKAPRAIWNMTASGAAAYNTIMDTSPIHYWPMGIGELDMDVVTGVGGKRNTLALNSFVAPFIAGAQRVVESVAANTEIDTLQNMQGLTGSFSIAFMINNTINNCRIVGNLNSGFTNGFSAAIGGFNQLVFVRITDSGAVSLASANNIFSANTFSHVVLVFDSTIGMLMYRNGALIANNAETDATLQGANTFRLYTRGDFSDSINLYRGRMQDVVIWNRALTAQEIEDISNAILGT